MYSAAEGGRNDVTKVAIVITDGRSTSADKTRAAAAAARAAGIVLLAVGITTKINRQELNDIATGPNADNVFTVNDFKDLSSIVRSLGTKTCEGKITQCTIDVTSVLSCSMSLNFFLRKLELEYYYICKKSKFVVNTIGNILFITRLL